MLKDLKRASKFKSVWTTFAVIGYTERIFCMTTQTIASPFSELTTTSSYVVTCQLPAPTHNSFSKNSITMAGWQGGRVLLKSRSKKSDGSDKITQLLAPVTK